MKKVGKNSLSVYSSSRQNQKKKEEIGLVSILSSWLKHTQKRKQKGGKLTFKTKAKKYDSIIRGGIVVDGTIVVFAIFGIVCCHGRNGNDDHDDGQPSSTMVHKSKKKIKQSVLTSVFEGRWRL